MLPPNRPARHAAAHDVLDLHQPAVRESPTAVAQSTTGQRETRPVSEKDTMTHPNSFGSRSTLEAGGRQYTIYRLDSLRSLANETTSTLPFSLKILLENLLRNEDGKFVKREDVEALATWDVKGKREKE